MPFITYEKIEDVPEFLKAEAKEQDGKFLVDASGLVNKNKELLDLNSKYKSAADKLKEFGDTDPKKAMEAIKEMERLEQDRKALNEVTQRAVQEAARDWEKKMGTVEKERDSLRGALEERIISADLDAAILAEDGDPFFVTEKLKASVKTFVENGKYVAKVIGADGQPRLNSKGEPMSMKELVAEAKGDKKFAPAFKAPDASGSGAKPGTQQSQARGQVVMLTREEAKNPQLYRQALETVKGDANLIQYKD